MKDIKIDINKLLMFLLLSLSILPVINIAGFDLPVLYLLMPLGILIAYLILLGWYKVPKITTIFTIFFLLIMIEIFLSTFYGTLSKTGTFDFPTDVIQYGARFIIMITFIHLFYNKSFAPEVFIKYFLIILNIGMLIGILQWIPWVGREILVTLYPFNNFDYQLSQLSNTMSGIRVHGIAQHATANGGLGMFFFIFAFSIYKYYKKFKFETISLMVLSILNIIASQARAGMLAIVFAIFLLYAVDVYINKKSFKPTIYLLSILLLTYAIGTYLYMNGNPFIDKLVYRWEHLIYNEQGGAGVRVDQIYYFLDLLKTPMDYLFGLSKQVVNGSAFSHGIEIEPPNIFVTYGLLGFILHYSLILILLIYFFRALKVAKNNNVILALLVASFVGLASYQVFSVGFYFFREVRVGLFPWLVMGVTIGVYEKYKYNIQRIKNSELINK